MEDNTNNNQEPNNIQYMPIGMCIGIGVGMAIGAALDNIPIGMCIGLSVGMCIGVIIDSKNKKKTDDNFKSDEKKEDAQENKK